MNHPPDLRGAERATWSAPTGPSRRTVRCCKPSSASWRRWGAVLIRARRWSTHGSKMARVNAIIPPLAIRGPSITIRKFAKERMTVEDLIRLNTLNKEMAEFLRQAVVNRRNVVISGGTGSGKTTTLNILSSYIPASSVSSRSRTPPSCSCHRSRGLAGVGAPRTLKVKGRSPFVIWSKTCVCGRIESSWASAAAARPWTCCKR